MFLSIAPSRQPLALLCLPLLLAGLPQGAPCADPALPAKIAPAITESPAASSAGVTTTFGGTAWDPVDGRWEALPDSVWTFDTGVGQFDTIAVCLWKETSMARNIPRPRWKYLTPPRALLCLPLLLACLSHGAPNRSAQYPPVYPAKSHLPSARFTVSPHKPANRSPETVTFFGGTTWNASKSRWEALQDSVWTFDSGVGSHFNHTDSTKNPAFHASMEGWTGLDVNTLTDYGRFRRMGAGDFSGLPCVGSTVGLGGNYSAWAGFTQAEADSACWVAGRGYGNSWAVDWRRDFAYDGAESLLFAYNYAFETEPGYDIVSVLVDTVGEGTGEVVLATYDGTGGGSESLFLEQGVHLPSAPGPITLVFRFESNLAGSDEHGLFPSDCGAFAVDDIVVSTTPYGGGINHLADFETGSDGWQEVFPEPEALTEDLTRLEALADLPSPWLGDCNLSDSVLVFYDPTLPGHPEGTALLAVSPWIDLAAAGLDGSGTLSLIYDRSLGIYTDAHVGWLIGVQYAPGCSGGVSSWSTFGGPSYADTCQTVLQDLTNEIPSTATELRVAIGVWHFCPQYSQYCLGPSTALGPMIDNVRLLVEGSTTSIRDDLAPQPPILAAPNPFDNSVTVHLAPELAGPGPVTLRIFDLQGRLVRELLAPDAAQPLTWDGRDAKGRATAPGVYFARAATAQWSGVTRIIRLR